MLFSKSNNPQSFVFKNLQLAKSLEARTSEEKLYKWRGRQSWLSIVDYTLHLYPSILKGKIDRAPKFRCFVQAPVCNVEWLACTRMNGSWLLIDC